MKEVQAQQKQRHTHLKDGTQKQMEQEQVMKMEQV